MLGDRMQFTDVVLHENEFQATLHIVPNHIGNVDRSIILWRQSERYKIGKIYFEMQVMLYYLTAAHSTNNNTTISKSHIHQNLIFVKFIKDENADEIKMTRNVTKVKIESCEQATLGRSHSHYVTTGLMRKNFSRHKQSPSCSNAPIDLTPPVRYRNYAIRPAEDSPKDSSVPSPTKNRYEQDDTIFSITFSSDRLGVNKTFLNDDSEWRLIYNSVKLTCNFDVKVKVSVLQPRSLNRNSFAPLRADTALTDFELRGVSGSVRVHSAVLAVASPVLGRMLEGKWQETENRVLTIPDTSVKTLRHLKDFIYLGVLPEDGVEQLLLLASCYMMEELEDKCVTKLIHGLTDNNAMETSKFALAYGMNKLYLGVLEQVQNGAVKVKDIRRHM